ncbi:MAG: flagellar basal body P-ring formation chaperone FlgA [Rhodobacterales bacterium]|nr:flagellar basal body P-ring formation chaperone FlgA [Rhodobacterales bacterium]
MKKLFVAIFSIPVMVVFMVAPAHAEMVVPTHTIRAQSILSREDLIVKNATVPGAYSNLDELLGLEARVALYPGRPIRPGDVGPAAIVERNQIVLLIYDRGGLRISTEGRSLMRGGAGDRIRVMNMASRATVSGRIQPSGDVIVSQ